MVNYYHRFLPGIATILAPLHAVSAGRGKDINWTSQCQQAFTKTKTMLSNVPLHHPQPQAKTSITVDASETAIGAQLEQMQNGHWVPLVFFSRKTVLDRKKIQRF